MSKAVQITRTTFFFILIVHHKLLISFSSVYYFYDRRICVHLNELIVQECELKILEINVHKIKELISSLNFGSLDIFWRAIKLQSICTQSHDKRIHFRAKGMNIENGVDMNQ